MNRSWFSVAKKVSIFSLALIGLTLCLVVLPASQHFNAASADAMRYRGTTADQQTARAPLTVSTSNYQAKASADAFVARQLGRGMLLAAVRAGSANALLSPFGGPSVTATKTASPASLVNPGDTITYTAVISNTGNADATGVNFADTIDPNTTFVAGSILVSPIAVNDTYNTIGNVNISVAAAQGLLANDLNPGGMGTLGFTLINATPFVTGTAVTTTHGRVTVNTDGSFTYNPTAGFSGPTDSFTYTLGNGTGKTDTATVTINISGMVWFVNNDPAAPGSAPGDGRLSNPFRSFGGASSFNTIATDAAGDAIFIYSGTANYTGGVTLLANQKLIGQGAGASLLAITGYSTPSGTNLLPSTGGTNPTITAAVDNITLGSGNTVRGTTLSVTAVGATALTGSSFGTLTLAETTIGGTNGRALSLTTGTLTGPVSSTAAFTSISSTNSSLTGISLTGVAGTMSSGSTTITNPTGIGLSVSTSSAALNFATTSASSSGGTGVSLLTNTGAITFAGLTITPDSGQRGLLATDNTNTITATSGVITTTTGIAVQITRSSSTTPLGISLTSVSANGGSNGIVLTNTSGSFTVVGDGANTNNSSGGTIQSTTGNGVSFTNVTNISLASMSIAGCAGDGLNGASVNGLILKACSVTNSGASASKEGLRLTELSGTVTLTSLTVTGSTEHNVIIQNTSATLASLTVTGGTFSNTNNAFFTASNGMIVIAKTTGVITTASVTGATFSNNFSTGVQVQAQDSATVGDFTVSGCTITNNGAAAADFDAGTGSPNIKFHMLNNINITGNKGPVINVFSSATGTGGLIQGRIDGNHVGTPGITDSGSTGGEGIRVFLQGVPGNITIVNNVIRETACSRGIGVSALGPAPANGSNRTSDIVIVGNDVDNFSSDCAFPLNDIYLTADDQAGTTVTLRAEVHGNKIKTAGATPANTDFPFDNLEWLYFDRTDSSSASPPHPNSAAQLVDFMGPHANANAAIAATQTMGSAKANAAVTLIAGPINTVTSVRPEMTAESESRPASMSQTDSGTTDSITQSDILRAARGEAPKDDSIEKLKQAEMNWMVQAAVERWRQTGASSEGIARLQAVTFELADLPDGQIASATSSHVKIDETGAGYGWYFDQTPNDDSEFAVPVPGKEFQTTEYSPAHGKIDLLTVVMRELGEVYLQDGKRIPKTVRKNLQPLMETTLSPSVRRLPDPSSIQLTQPAIETQNLQSSTQSAPVGSGSASQSSSSSPRGRKPAVHTSSTLSPLSSTFPLSLGTLPPGESITIMFQATVNALPLPVGTSQVCNQGTVSGSNFSNVLTDDPGKPGAADPTCTTLNVADLAVTKSDTPDPVIAGNNITYTVNFVNNGPAPASTVTVTDAVPANTTFVSAVVTTGSGWGTAAPAVGGTGNIVFSKATVASGETAVFTIVVKVTNTTPHLTVITNSVTAASTTNDTTPANNTASTTTTVTGLADLVLTKTASPTPNVVAGNNITYTLNFTNNGPGTAVNVAVTDAVPANTTFVSAVVTTGTGWGVVNPAVGGTGNVVFSKASVASGETAVFTIVVNVAGTVTAGTVITNTGTATANTSDPTPADATSTTTTTVIAQADLAVTKTDTPDPVLAGNNITYTINFVNNGPGSAVTTTVTDAVPANTTFVSAVVTTGIGWSTSAPAVGGTGNIVFSKATVANAETAVFTVVVKVNANTANGATITNSATAASTTSDPTPGNNTGTATTTVNTQADLAVTKSDAPDPVSAGANITYTVNFVNNGPSDAQTVTVTDAVPTNATFVSAVVTTGTGWSTSAPAVGGTGNIVFSKATVAAAETAVFTIVVKVNSSTADGTVITNSATGATATTDPTPGNNTGTATTTVQARADLAITKTDSPDPVSAGGNLTYTVNFANTGPSDAQTVMITDAVPANATFVSAVVTTGVGWGTAAPAVGGTGNIVFTKATVVAGETAVFTIVVKVNSNTASGATISNTATAASATTDPTPANNSATATTTVQTSADLAVTKSDSPDPSFAGTNITYTINFVNNGPSDAQTVTVTDAVPTNTTFVSATVTTGTGWSTSAPAVGGTGNVVFSKATVTSGETAVFTIVVLVDPSTATGTVITNSATAASTTTDPTPGNNTGTATTTIQAQADLAVTKTDSPDPVLAGNNITYTINFINNGPGAAQAVTVTDAVPANATFVSAVVTTGTGWSTSAPAVGGTGNVVFSKATVANGETAVFTIVVKVNSNVASGATISNSATAASTTADPTPGNNTGTATTTVNTQADLSITKTDSPDPVVAGANITYTITLTNNGPSDAQTVTVTDTVPPANTTLVSAVVTTGTGWSTGGSVTFSKATVAAGETAVFTIVVKVNSNTVQGTVISNTATAATATTDPNSGNNSSTTTTDVIVRADLAVTKSDSPDPVIAGNNLTYTVNYINNGPSDAQTVTVTDAVPANATFVSATVTVGAGWSVSAPAVGGTGNVVFSKATSLALDAATFTIVVNINPNTANGTTITNNATAATATTDPTPGNNTGTATTTVQAVADIAVTKSDSPDPVFAGNNITYTINFANNGPSFAQSVTVTDAVPANTTFVSATVTTGTGWSTSAPAVGGTGNVVFSKSPVANGETAVFTIVVKVNTNTAGGTTITNSAVGASTTTDPTPGNNTGTATTTVQTQADLAVTKTDSPDPVIAGNNLTYTVNFVNNGPSDALTVTVTDPVPTNATFVSATVTTGTGWSTTSPAVGGTGNIVFTKAMVVNGETAVFTIVVRVNPNTANGATITNSATAASTTGDPTPGNNTGTATTTVQTNADLAVTKSDSPDPVFAGNNLTYTINFVNNGPSDAQTVTVTDAVPANATFVSATVTTGTGWSTSAPAVGATGNVVFSKGTAAAGETTVFTIVVKVNSNTPNGATITNSATAASPTTDPTPGNNTGTATTTVQTRADIAVTKSDSPDPVFAGANLTYTINFVNNGPSDAQTVTVTDAVPANTTFVSATVTTGTGWTTTSPAVGGTGNVVFSKATVTAGEAAVFTIVVKVNSSTVSGTTITNSVTAATATTDPTPGNNTATTTTTVQTQADISVVKTDSPDPVVVSQNLTYTINFANNGPSDAQTVSVTDPMPPNTTFVSATVTTGSGWSTTAPAVGGTGTITFSKGTVAAGQTAVFTIVVNVNLNTPNNTILTNTVTAATATTDPTPGNNTSTTTTTVLAQADLAITKMAAPDPSCVGGDITYSLNIVNNGPGPGINTTITDATPANTTFVSASVMSGSGWSISSPAVGGTGNVVFSKASFGIGETAVLVVVVKVNAGTVHGTVISNTATIASDIPDPTPGNNSSSASTTVDPIPPTITCPANVTVKAPTPGQPCVVVNYDPPVASDNCPGVQVVCVPPSGSCFPLGTSTVTCTATDLAGNSANCSFTVSVFDLCVQDDSDPSTVVLINSLTGDYRFCCHGVVYTGRGTITNVGLLFTLQHNATDRRVLVKDDEATHRATGSIQAPPGTIRCSITDRNTQDNTCTCP